VQVDLGIQGLAILTTLALGFGNIAQLVRWKSGTRWLWLVGAIAYFIGGLFVSEVMFATATEDELQPIIDGLVFDEAMLFSLVPGIAAVAVAWYVARRGRPSRTTPV